MNRIVPQPPISARAGNRTPVHPSITQEIIDVMVERFYEKIQSDERLGPIFEERILISSGGDWTPHLAKMKHFWGSVLLKSGAYKGQPVVVHNALTALKESDFEMWLSLFQQTVGELFEPDAAQLIYENAKRIARSLFLSRFGKADTTPPF